MRDAVTASLIWLVRPLERPTDTAEEVSAGESVGLANLERVVDLIPAVRTIAVHAMPYGRGRLSTAIVLTALVLFLTIRLIHDLTCRSGRHRITTVGLEFLALMRNVWRFSVITRTEPTVYGVKAPDFRRGIEEVELEALPRKRNTTMALRASRSSGLTTGVRREHHVLTDQQEHPLPDCASREPESVSYSSTHLPLKRLS